MAKIKTIETADGRKRYRFRVEIGRDADGKRLQRCYTFDRKKDAEAELHRIGHQRRTGEFVDRSKITVSEVIDRYLKHAAFEAEENTKLSYRLALEPVRTRLGHRLAQSIDREDVEQLRDWMLASGRKRGGKPGTGLGARSVRLTLGRMSAAWALAIRDRLVMFNPVQYVEAPELVRAKRDTWSGQQVREFLAAAAQDRLHAAWRLSLYGLRRGEVCGLRWEDIDLAAGTISINQTRVLVDGEIVVKGTKSERGVRTLPLDPADIAALEALRDRQVTEAMEAGRTYEAGLGELGWYAAGDKYVVTDELGIPVHPDWYSDEFHRLRERAGLPRIRLHDSRHTANSLMAAAGVPPHIRAAWCGHTVAVNEDTYTHARPEDLAVAAAALSAMRGTAGN